MATHAAGLSRYCDQPLTVFAGKGPLQPSVNFHFQGIDQLRFGTRKQILFFVGVGRNRKEFLTTIFSSRM